MKLKRLFAFVLTLIMLFAAVALVIPAAAESYEAEVLGASIRTVGNQGLRFIGKIRKSATVQPGEEANFGFLLIPETMVESTTEWDQENEANIVTPDDITLETAAVKKVPAVKLMAESSVQAALGENYQNDYESFYYFTAVITNIPAPFYGVKILARIYVTENETNAYSGQISRSVQYVANAINEMGGEVPEFITEVLADYELYGKDIFVDADSFAEEFWATQGGQMPDPGNDPGNDPGEVISSFGAYKYVAVIGIDGAGRFFQNTSTPNFDSIFAGGATTYSCLTPVSISAQSWGSMLHGVTANYHKLTNATIEDSSYRYPTNSQFPSIFRVLHEAKPTARLASIVGWDPINTGIVEDGLGVNVTKQSTGSNDALVRDRACAYLDEQIPTFLFVQFDQVDLIGHNSGWGGTAFLNQITTDDGYIGEIFAKYQAAGVLNDTLFILTADHGGSGTGHGGSTDDHCRVLLAARGKTVVNGTIGEVENRDIAAIVTYALGIEQPSGWTSRVPSGLFEGVDAQDRPLPPAGNVSARYHANEDTPENALTYISNNISKSLYLYLPLDGDATDATGQKSTCTNGKLYFGDDNGYYGGATAFDDGYISVSNYYPGTNDFSISFWINTYGTMGDPAILANKDWASGKNSGWILALHSTRLLFNFGNGSSRRDIGFTLPSDYQDGWVHVIITVNHSANRVKCYYDFAERSPEYDANGLTLTGTSLTNGSVLNIGQDGLAHEPDHLPGFLDDIMIFNGVLTDSDVAALRTYYKK